MKKLKGSTLIEVMVALALTSFAMTLSVVIYLNIQKSTLPFLKLKAAGLAAKHLRETIANRAYFDAELSEGGFLLKQAVTRSRDYPDCLDISVRVFDNNKKMQARLRTTIYAE